MDIIRFSSKVEILIYFFLEYYFGYFLESPKNTILSIMYTKMGREKRRQKNKDSMKIYGSRKPDPLNKKKKIYQ